jgi:hypothetical protein
VQKGLLCNASDYFVKALEGQFEEGLEQTLTLPGCDEDTFKLFLYWLCNHNLPEPFACTRTDSEEHKANTQDALVRLWCLSDMVLIPGLQNETIKVLLACLERTRVSLKAVKTTCELTTEGSHLHKAIMDELAFDIVSSALYHDKDLMSSMEAIQGLMGEMLERIIEGGNIGATNKGSDVYMVPEDRG